MCVTNFSHIVHSCFATLRIMFSKLDLYVYVFMRTRFFPLAEEAGHALLLHHMFTYQFAFHTYCIVLCTLYGKAKNLPQLLLWLR